MAQVLLTQYSIQRSSKKINCDSDKGGEEGIDHGEDQEECGFRGLPLQVSHPQHKSISS